MVQVHRAMFGFYGLPCYSLCLSRQVQKGPARLETLTAQTAKMGGVGTCQ